MAKKDPRIDAYIERSAPFAKPILKHLRAVVHAGCPQVVETIKWSMPHFDYKGIMCGMAAFKHHCAFGFWKSKLILPRAMTANKDAMGHFGCIRSIDELPSRTVLIQYVKKAAVLNESGTQVPGRDKPKKRPPLKIPDYFSKALNKNAKAKKTFDDFSPSHRREYIEWITDAKRDETRQKRLETAIQWMSEGKPQNWRYMK
ncbi:MAG TPA: YdeI/OmpD-associated family protein [Chthoniobacterales bacterium]|jgi:uncharacterized protein YdeI (YjbR/CyaY-like superfamily)